MSRWPAVRDVCSYALGVAVVVHETFVARQERVQLLVLAGAALGLPAVLRRNGK